MSSRPGRALAPVAGRIGNRLPTLPDEWYKAQRDRTISSALRRGLLTLFYGLIFLLSGIMNFFFTLMILRELSSEKQGLSFFDLRWYVLKNLNNYKELTKSRYGRVGFPYYGYLTTLAALILAAALCLNSLGK